MISKAWKEVLLCTEVNDYAVKQGIQWKFIVNLVPWMGGFYKRLVGFTKRALCKTIGLKRLTETQLITVLTEVETVVNSRPLVYVGSDILITPLSFLSLNHDHFVFDFTCSDDHEDPEFKTTENVSTAQQILKQWKSGQRCMK